jgi:flagellar motor protein MotB
MKMDSRGPQTENEARKIAMYLCQELTAAELKKIADYFNLGYAGSVSFISHQIRQKKRENKRFRRTVEGLIKSRINQATCPLITLITLIPNHIEMIVQRIE